MVASAREALSPSTASTSGRTGSGSKPGYGRRIVDDISNKAAVLRPGQDQGQVRAADRQPLREQLRRGGGEAPPYVPTNPPRPLYQGRPASSITSPNPAAPPRENRYPCLRVSS